MWDVENRAQRYQHFSECDGCFIPGYTGHCPSYQFSIGQSYGNSTRHILKDIRRNGFFESSAPYREDFKFKMEQLSNRPNTTTFLKSEPSYFIPGYAGYVPGLSSRFGEPYGHSADESMKEFKQRETTEALCEAERELILNKPTQPRYMKRRKRQTDENKWSNDRSFNPELPPLVGYTGHIPGSRMMDVSLGRGVASARALRLHKGQTQAKETEDDSFSMPCLPSSYRNYG